MGKQSDDWRQMAGGISPDHPLTLTIEQAAHYTGFGRHALRDAVAAGLLRVIRNGRTIRVSLSELDRFVGQATVKGLDLADIRPARRASWPSGLGLKAKRKRAAQQPRKRGA